MTTTGIAASDFQALNELKLQAGKDAKKALPEVARQFEGIFLQAMLKSMRGAEHFLDESSPFKGKNQETFQEMLDSQYANSISKSKGIGLAEVLSKQLAQQVPLPEKKQEVAPVAALEVQQEHTESGIEGFVKSIWPLAKQAAATIGLDPKLLVAQAALETGWGKFVAKGASGESSNNLFNIKANASTKDVVEVQTTEYIANTPIKVNAAFRKYDSAAHSFGDYVSLIKDSERYQDAVAHAGNPERYVRELHKAGYATDPQYGDKILKIYHGNELNQAIKRCEMTNEL